MMRVLLGANRVEGGCSMQGFREHRALALERNAPGWVDGWVLWGVGEGGGCAARSTAALFLDADAAWSQQA